MEVQTTTSVVVDILKVVGLPGFIAWLWAQDRKNTLEAVKDMAAALRFLAEKVGGAVEAARNHQSS